LSHNQEQVSTSRGAASSPLVFYNGNGYYRAMKRKKEIDEPEEEPEALPELTVKQQRFIEEYCTDFNATQAAIRAGYSEKTAYNAGWQNVRKCEIAEAIKMRLSELAMSAEEITRRLAQWGRGTMEPFLDGAFINLTSEKARENLHLVKKYSITDKGVSIELQDQKDAVIQLAKMQGLFVEKHEHTGKDGGPIEVTVNIVNKPRET